ncbi:MAG TPA: terminase gpA endonuclease subunit [Mesorhizobium sp.]|jgi:phage terminase large subunit GpA-like protein|uniref:phage terminase large subunit family protein n=1 Tax=Mesorhizobium sp. TaxID=1871066 RepID=UPI002DDCA8E0|nr:terminase gpA endonuclease subunit [Mesorhizobium sp.]HEV2501468.1 terminase gpA endonuclease subunit [Mesorhizobium sp.]
MRVRFPRSALAIVAGALAAVISPSERLAPSAWAQEHLIVPDGPKAGEIWDAGLTPYILEPLDMLGMDSGINEMAVRKSAQTGFTMMLLASTAHYIDQDPCRIMIVQPTSGALADFNREKLSLVIEKSEPLKSKVRSQTSRQAGASTGTSKVYPGGSLTLAIATSAADLRSKTIKVALLDEIDEYPDDLDNQGDPLVMVEARQESFLMSGDWKRAKISTPTIKGDSKIDQAFEAGDQRYWFMPCPGCGEQFHFVFDRKHFKFEEVYPFKAHYVTPCCGSIVESHEKVALMKKGRWIATATRPGAYPSYHFDALTSPFVPWEKIAQRFIEASGDPKKLKAFYNLTLGLAYDVKGDAPDHVQLMARRSPELKRGHIPPLGLVLVGSADVQMNGIWYVIKAYGPDRQSWRVDAGYIAGATDDPFSGAFAVLEEIRQRRWPDAFGNTRQVDAFGVDSGYRSHVVYTWVRGKAATFALKGLDGWSRPALGQPTPVDIDFNGKRIRSGAMVWGVGTWSLKAAFYADLAKQGGADGMQLTFPAGYCHFGGWMDEVYFRQITSEYLGNENYRGRIRRVWLVRSGEENHLLDCEVYGAALAEYLGVSRMTEEQWRTLIADRGVPDEVKLPDMFAPAPMKAQANTQPSNTMKSERAYDSDDGVADSWWNQD